MAELPPPFQHYEQHPTAYDGMFASQGMVRSEYGPLHEMLTHMTPEELYARQQTADLSFLHQGITFTVYSNDEGTEKIFPYDLLPRIVTAKEWEVVERGLAQRITALNMFLKDIYNQ